MSESSDQAEIAELRQQIEGFRQRELTQLREQLAVALADVAHYLAEAERNTALGRQIYTEGEAERSRLIARIQSLEQLPNARPPAPNTTISK